MAFMQPEITFMAMLHIETTCGVELVPVDLVGNAATPVDLEDYLQGKMYPDGHSREVGYYARLSAPGYLDATDWSGPYQTEAEARDGLAEMHDICPHCWAQCYYSDNPCEDEG